MASRQQEPNEQLAQKINKNHLQFLIKVIANIGRPLYLLLLYSVIGLLFLIALIGKIFRQQIGQISRIRLRPEKTIPQISFPQISFPRIFLKRKIKIRFRIKWPELKFKLPRIGRPTIDWVVIYGLIIFSTFALFFWYAILRDLPSPQDLKNRDLEVSTKIYDRNHILLYTIYEDKNRSLITLNQVPLHVQLATLAAEDAEFYSHPGFSVKGILRATLKNIKKGELTGGSTITQQLIKNALLSSEKTFTRKVREIILSVATEFTFSKDEILEMYLNEVSYGGSAYGIQEAARVYFNKDVGQLSLGEAAFLAGLPKSPSRFSPFGSNPELARSRQEEVLNLMLVNKFISQEQYQEALGEELKISAHKIEIKAPHFVMYVKQMLAEKYGEELIEKGGLEVITTLDYQIQKLAEEVVSQEISKLVRLNVTNAAVVVLNPQTGEILAMVGSKDYFDIENDGNVNVALRPRQPGSSIKIINYAYALSHNYTPATIIQDAPVKFSVPGQPLYTPRNYDNQFRGNITLRSALAESRNIPAVRVLASYGVDKMIDLGQKMGITTWTDPANYGLSLTLGGGEIKLLDLAQVFSTVANSGRRPEITSILKITNYRHRVLEEKKDRPQEEVLDPRVAFLLIDILRDNQARTPAFGSQSALVIPNHSEVAVKTGTSNNLRDNLTIGFNQNYLVAVWVGNNDNSPMARVASGVTGASPIWNKILASLLAEETNHDWEVPQGLVQVPICSLTGTLPCQGCPVKQEWFLEENQPTTYCSPKKVEEIKQTMKPQGTILEPAAATSR